MTATEILFSDQIRLDAGSHILYLYDSREAYVRNVFSFIRDGLELGQEVVLIDSPEICAAVKTSLAGENRGSLAKLDFAKLHLFDYRQFYQQHGGINNQTLLRNWEALFAPLMKRNQVRSWGRIYWTEQNDIHDQLCKYEQECDHSVRDGGIIGVCAYDAKRIPAALQNEMMRVHEYVMTDSSVARSPFYHGQPASFPSPSVQSQLQTEMESYRQKLDFVHAVSHEVRNPLTVIKAYAKMMLGDPPDGRHRDKLAAIIDYVDVIDHEIAHIINTEQMLLTDSLWVRTDVEAAPVVQEVAEMMSIKARTQNISLITRLDLKEERVSANVIGMKLIVSNLLSNATKYSDEGGRVWLEARRTSARELEIRIRDEGCGMTREQLNKLYRKYEKMNVEKSGQGIGLFMVKKLVDHFEGTISVDSEPDRGTEVTIRLPCSA